MSWLFVASLLTAYLIGYWKAGKDFKLKQQVQNDLSVLEKSDVIKATNRDFIKKLYAKELYAKEQAFLKNLEVIEAEFKELN
jgi:hypothetical protein